MLMTFRMMNVMMASYTMIVSAAKSWMKNWCRLPYSQPLNEIGDPFELW